MHAGLTDRKRALTFSTNTLFSPINPCLCFSIRSFSYTCVSSPLVGYGRFSMVCGRYCRYCSVAHLLLALCDPRAAARQVSVSLHQLPQLAQTIELVMTSNHLILCCSLLFLPSIFPSIRVFSNESDPSIRLQYIGSSAAASVLLMNIQGLFPSRLI